MTGFLKKSAIIILGFLGGVGGYWLARENQRAFELPRQDEQSRLTVQQPSAGMEKIAVGMDTWQVKEVLGPPDKRYVASDDRKEKKEVWIYGGRYLYFTNGFLTSWQE